MATAQTDLGWRGPRCRVLWLALLGGGAVGCWVPPPAPWAPTPRAVVRKMLRMARVGPRDVVYDLGSGDGRIVITAAKEFGARAVGIEYKPFLVRHARERARRAGVADRVRFRQQDFFKADLRSATVVALYLYRHINLRLRPKLLRELRPGSRVVAHRFDMGAWRPDLATPVGGPRVFVWIVPAQVSGEWRWGASALGAGVLRITQRFQTVRVGLTLGGRPVKVDRAALRGNRLRIALRRGAAVEILEGRVSGEVMRLSARGGSERWTARRVRRGPPLDSDAK